MFPPLHYFSTNIILFSKSALIPFRLQNQMFNLHCKYQSGILKLSITCGIFYSFVGQLTLKVTRFTTCLFQTSVRGQWKKQQIHNTSISDIDHRTLKITTDSQHVSFRHPFDFRIISTYIHVWLMLTHITHNVICLLYDHLITSNHV